MHIGSYDEEYKSIELIEQFISDNNLINIIDKVNKHHEVYLSDPRRTAIEKLKTVLHFPVARCEGFYK